MSAAAGVTAASAAGFVSRLSSRGVIRLTGKDALPFLQGMVTNDLVTGFAESSESSSSSSCYAAALSSKGRIISDLFAIQDDEGGVLVECDGALKDQLHRHLRMHKLRKDVHVSDASSDFASYAVVGESETAHAAAGSGIAFRDPRCTDLGSRLLLPAAQKIVEAVPEGVYRAHRLFIGIVEGEELAGVIPHEGNLDALNALCFTKGCYVGQELVARTEHTGVVRKRVLPFKTVSTGVDVMPGDRVAVAGASRRKLGRVLAVDHAAGIGAGIFRLANVFAENDDSNESVSTEETPPLIGTTSKGGSVALARTPPEWWSSS